ncbi:expressed unknown protein [Seminavis robusta]|uniref:Uncharacterized protein n=1 Tax=Seminavis robusta TaxID=568900 RepID=A0A9N8EP54_9STRA|nr:expressed unknown protein [Seminavis robusta]|eukprot:Sro1470_g275390.1 n/a (347) ;mRNA; r:21750-22907
MSTEDSKKPKETTNKEEEPTLYRGKWTTEEDAYAHCLIAEFRAGTLDIPSGTTLRGFLAKKLECAPKRVSKKFENSGYNGKQLYCPSAIYISNFESEFRRRNLEFLRQRFMLSRGRPVPKESFKKTPQDLMFESFLAGKTFENRNDTAAGLKRPATLLAEDATSRLLELSRGMGNSSNVPPAGMLGSTPRFETLARDLHVGSPILPMASPLLSRPMVGADAFVGANRHGLSSTAMCAKNAALSMRQQALRDLPLLQSPSAHAWSRPLLEPSALVNRPARQTEGSRLREDFLLLQLSKQHPFATPSATSAHLRFLQAEERKRLGVIKADPSGDIGDMVRPVKRVKMY